MIFHPAVMALLVADAVGLFLLVPTALFAVAVLRHWDLASGSARQIRMEQRTHLVATALGFVFLIQVLALLLFVFTADRLAVQFVGAMCAVGTLNVNPFGFPAFYLKLTLFFLAVLWLFLNHVDNRAPDYPFIRVKYALLLLVAPVAVLAAWVELRYFLGLKAEVITSCCGSLFSDTGESVEADLAALAPRSAMVAFYAVTAAAIAIGGWARRGRGVPWLAPASAIAFVVTLAAVVSFIAPYVYEHPHHHCPFCLLKPEYGYVGYVLYLPLFLATGLGAALGITHLLARGASARAAVAEVTRGVASFAAAMFLLLMIVATVLILRSNLVLLE